MLYLTLLGSRSYTGRPCLNAQCGKMVCEDLFLSGLVGIDGPVELVAHQNAFILHVLADQRGVGDHAALYQLAEADQAAQLALEVESVAFIGDHVDVALAGFDDLEELVDLDIVK